MERIREEPVRTPKRLPSPREYALLGWDARLEVLAMLHSIRLAYLKTEEATPSSSRQTVVYPYTGDRLPLDIHN
jgi:hypothetical protein